MLSMLLNIEALNMFRSCQCHTHLSFLFILLAILLLHFLNLLMLASGNSSSILLLRIISAAFPFNMFTALFAFLCLGFLLVALLLILLVLFTLALLSLSLILSIYLSWSLVPLFRCLLPFELPTFLSFILFRFLTDLHYDNLVRVVFLICFSFLWLLRFLFLEFFAFFLLLL